MIPGPGQLLKVQARLAELDPGALDIADPVPPADQVSSRILRTTTWLRNASDRAAHQSADRVKQTRPGGAYDVGATRRGMAEIGWEPILVL